MMNYLRNRSLRRASVLAYLLTFGGLLLVGIGSSHPAYAGDPSGEKTGVSSDVVGMTAGSPTAPDLKSVAKTEPFAAKLADSVGQNRIAINLVWTLLTGFLVMFMQAGFALLETGFCRAKNALHTVFMNIAIYPIGVFSFFLVGFALMFGASNMSTLGGTAPLAATNEFSIHLFGKSFGLFAHKGFALSGDSYDVGVFVLFLFQVVFMDTAATIPTGAMAERWKTSAFVIYGFFIAGFLYPMFGNWAWGGGWLSQLGSNFALGHGYVDFAGSGVVHAVGGLCGLAGAMVLGPRIGKYNRDGSVNPFPGHHLPMAVLGTLILAFGWFGFNPGSTLAASGAGALRIGIVATCTMLASVTGALAAWIWMKVKYGKPDTSMLCNGLLAGLVAITAPSGFVNATDACIIGFIAGIIVCAVVPLLDKLRIDDPVGAVAVHGANGLWGVIAVGLFADGKANYGGSWNGVNGNVAGLFHGGGVGQLEAQLIGCITLIVWAWGLSYVFFKVQDAIQGIRVTPEIEIEGLDMPELGAVAYPSFAMSHGGPGEGPSSAPHIPVPPVTVKQSGERISS